MASVFASFVIAASTVFTTTESPNYHWPHPWPILPSKPKHRKHKPKPKPPFHQALASYYDIDGTGACGVGSVQSGYRFASLFLSCGQRIVMCHNGCVEAIMSDHGPYVAGRAFDLNVNLKHAIGCSDLCVVRWRATPIN
jgi:hypothetical protein